MFGFFWKKDSPEKQAAEELYAAVVKHSRNPVLYRDYSVPDTIDGRFEMIVLHAYLLIRHIQKESPDLAQALFDEVFLDMDRSLREMGVGDLSVPKKMKVMLSGYNGRRQAYEEAFSGHADMTEVVKRNIYGTLENADEKQVLALVEYIRTQLAYIKQLEVKAVTGANCFAEQEVLNEKGERHVAAE